ncbi:hypothetical protein JCGZ_19577 [Jatropha curcas]|uniref:Phytocyanin domain-containing protein n=1 Tax=Jatropha curcas TaxID=180498 RepID=A0A067JUJ8_JATCU|nr:hypothetical protein JCGZ_19577 [Jatropha curcas]
MANEGTIAEILMVMSLLVLHCNSSHGASTFTHLVGSETGWRPTVSMETWPNGKTFYAEFNYNQQVYDVIVVDGRGYETCTVTSNAKPYYSGKDKLKLALGGNYFISSNSEYCQNGMRLAINAKQRPHQ